MPTVQTELWFDSEALEAAELWTSLVPNSRILEVRRDQGGNPLTREGAVLHVQFELNGQRFGAVNGGPHFPLSEAVSISPTFPDQDEADRCWTELTREGSESMCGWCKDRFGMSWQIVPQALLDLQTSDDPAVVRRSTQAMMAMHCLNAALIRRIALAEDAEHMPEAVYVGLPVPNALYGAVRLPVPQHEAWRVVSEPGWWINDGELREHRIEADGARRTVTDPVHGTFVLSIEDVREGEHLSLRDLTSADPRRLVQIWADPLADGTSMVRILESGFRDGGAADDDIRPLHDQQAQGWRLELEALRAHLSGAGDGA